MDVNKNQTIKQESFEALRAAVQNGLLEVEDAYDNYEVLTTAQMLEQWLLGFVNNHSLDYKDLTIGFVRIEAEPPYYLVKIEGYVNDYALLTTDAYVQYTSGAMIVSENERVESVD